MKRKIISLSLLLAATAPAFAQYGNDSILANDGFLTFISIILLASGALQIILFFKVWIMTNDVNVLKKKYIDNASFIPDELKTTRMAVLKLKLSNKTEEAYSTLNGLIFDRMLRNFNSNGKIGFENNKKFVFSLYSELYNQIGKEIPEELRNLTAEDFMNFGLPKKEEPST